jgi:hypothetical protein
MALKAWMLGWMLLATCTGLALGDELVLATGRSIKGTFGGFRDHRFLFKSADGKDVAEFAANVRSIAVASPLSVSVQLVGKQYDNVQFKGFSRFTVRLVREDEELEEPVALLKLMELADKAEPKVSDEQEPPEAPAEPVAVLPKPAVTPAPAESLPDQKTAASPKGERAWNPSGKWQSVVTPGVQTISHGETVEIGPLLKKGVVNVVHFHLGSAHSSVRQGNYVETLAGKSKGRVAIRRVDIPDWKAPICEALGLKSLPQFWFYSRTGRETKKLTERFTEADIESALKEALRAE